MKSQLEQFVAEMVPELRAHGWIESMFDEYADVIDVYANRYMHNDTPCEAARQLDKAMSEFLSEK